jgi:hypothetical protein
VGSMKPWTCAPDSVAPDDSRIWNFLIGDTAVLRDVAPEAFREKFD